MPPLGSVLIEHHVSLTGCNTLGIAATADELVRVATAEDLRALILAHPQRAQQAFVLGAGANLVLTGDVHRMVLKMQIKGRALVGQTPQHWIVEAGAGEIWHDFVAWTLEQGWPGLENLALIPGTVGAAPVQNIGAYGLELQARLASLDYIDLHTGQTHTLDAAACCFAYRDSVFKGALKERAVITHVRFALPKRWTCNITYADLAHKAKQANNAHPDAPTIFAWVSEIRRTKLPDPAQIGNVGSFFKNPVVSHGQCRAMADQYPTMPFYTLPDGTCKLAAAWLIDACGWRGRRMGLAGVHPQHALVLVNRGLGDGLRVTGAEVLALARAIQTSVDERFGVQLEIEPVVL